MKNLTLFLLLLAPLGAANVTFQNGGRNAVVYMANLDASDYSITGKVVVQPGQSVSLDVANKLYSNCVLSRYGAYGVAYFSVNLVSHSSAIVNIDDGVFAGYDAVTVSYTDAPASGGGGGGESLALADQLDLFMKGFFAAALFELIGLMWRTFKRGAREASE